MASSRGTRHAKDCHTLLDADVSDRRADIAGLNGRHDGHDLLSRWRLHVLQCRNKGECLILGSRPVDPCHSMHAVDADGAS